MPQVMNTLAAGTDTSSSVIATMLHLLAQHPEAQAQARAEVDALVASRRTQQQQQEGGDLSTGDALQLGPEDMRGALPYLSGVFTEAIRMHAPVPGINRQLDRDLHLAGGVTVPRGQVVYCPLKAFSNDASLWPQAGSFLPERHLPGHEHLLPADRAVFMPFGGGARMCPGQRLAQLQALVVVARVLRAFEFAPAPGAPPTRWIKALVHAPDHVTLTFERRRRMMSGPDEKQQQQQQQQE